MYEKAIKLIPKKYRSIINKIYNNLFRTINIIQA